MLASDDSADFMGQLNRDLWKACSSSNPEEAEMLLECGAKVNGTSMDYGGKAALRIAVDAEGPTVRMLETVKNVLRHSRVAVDQLATDGMTALHSALVLGKHEVARLLLKHGADLSKCTADGRTALICAVTSGTVPAVEICLDSAADVASLLRTPAPDGSTPCVMAFRLGFQDVVSYLMEMGADAPSEGEAGQPSPVPPQGDEGAEDPASAEVASSADP